MSQTALASGICSSSAISRWESGQSVPSDGVILQLADRLELPAEILTHRDFNSRLLTSGDGFGVLVEAAFDRELEENKDSPIASWISRARQAANQADPWLRCADPRQNLDDLALDPLTSSVPVSLETVELLDALIRVKESKDLTTVDALSETLSWTVDAPQSIRRAAVEAMVAVLVTARMPIAARGAVIRADLPEITVSTAILLTLGGSSTDGLPPLTSDRSARDVAFGVISLLSEMPKQERQNMAKVVIDSCPNDELVYLWACERGLSLE